MTYYSVLPLRDIVVFPQMIVPLFVGREKSVAALEEAMRNSRQIFLLSQKDAGEDDPGEESLYNTGTISQILQLLRLPDGTVKVLVEGKLRARVKSLEETDDHLQAEAEIIEDSNIDSENCKNMARSTLTQFEQYVRLNKKIAPEVMVGISQIEEASKLGDTIASHLNLKIEDKQELLCIADVGKRLERIFSLMEGEMNMLNVEKKIRSRVKRQMEDTQREYYLNEQLKAIQKELGDNPEGKSETAELEEKIAKTRFSKEAREKAISELKRLKNMSPMAAEATVVRNYLDWLLCLPWGKKSRVKKNIPQAEKTLDIDHYGLGKVKERIVEYLAVQSRTDRIRGPILCLVGPPGVGKTSLGQSIAKATGRKFCRIALGGVRDESEIRGHRRTYIGSMPGKIIQALKKAGTSNPLILLDEIDKMGQDFRGDPASAMLEVLDPEQNAHFNDHYMEVDYDLSNVMFVTTANSLNMSQPLLDRMEIIQLSGYTEEEKIEIFKRHLYKKQIENHGLGPRELTIREDAIRDLIRYYTREAGVRNLERELAKIARKALKEILESKAKRITITRKNLENFVGVPRFRYGISEETDQIGATTGLAWTEVGGELLTIEAVTVYGKGGIKTTGKLGDVMQESIQAALSFVKSRCTEYGIAPTLFDRRDIHIHVPEGATPKDGPSAGVAMVTSIVSILTGIPVRKDVAMTGEVTLRGNVLPIGGLKEKLLAALRGGIKTVFIPEENKRDLTEIPEKVIGELEIVPVKSVDEVLDRALTEAFAPIPWDEEEDLKSPQAIGQDHDESDVRRRGSQIRH